MAQENKAPATNINDERAVRRAKRQELIDAGINPYPIESNVDAHAGGIRMRYESLEDGVVTQDEYTIAGRIRAKRMQGKLGFLVLEDVTGEIQLFCRVNDLGEEQWNLLKLLDLGDILQATGVVTRTKRGELSILPSKIKLLSKSLRPLPEKFHGLTDRELRYRQRYVDLIMNPEVRETFRKRSRIISLIRSYMEAQSYMEVETPMMHAIVGGATAKPFVTHFNALDRDFYLRIATELPLKRLLVGGMERVFEIGRQFRNEGMDLTHNPEFTTMEAYCAYSDLDGMKVLTEGLFKEIARKICGCEEGKEVLQYQGQTIDLSGTWRSATVAEIASEVCGEELSIDTPIEHLRKLNADHGIEWQESWGAGKLLFELYDELGEQTLINPTFVCDYPEEVSPLAKRKDDDPRITDRFELVIAGHEYANSFTELNDPVDQAGRFAEQVAAKGMGDDEAMGYDYDYVRALEYGMPPAGGIGYGIDRMVMLFCDAASIRDVLLFPAMKPELVTKADIEAQVAGAHTDNPSASVDELVANNLEGAGAETKMDTTTKLDSKLSREQAFELLKKYNEDTFHIQHGETVEALMRYFAKQYDPENVDFWGQVGLLHDLDWEKWQDDRLHTVKTAELLEEAGADPYLAHAIQTHNSDLNEELPQPEAKMECILYAVDELSGLIQAAARMRPSGSVKDMPLKSLKKKFKDKRFAAGCDRNVIAHGAELNNMELDELLEMVLDAMKEIAPVGDIYAHEEEPQG